MANNEKKDGNVFGGAVKTAEVKATAVSYTHLTLPTNSLV